MASSCHGDDPWVAESRLEELRPWWLRSEPVERQGAAGTRYYDVAAKWTNIGFAWLFAAFILVIAPVPNPNFPTWLNVAKAVLLGAAALGLAIYVYWLGQRMGLIVWNDSVSIQFYFRVDSYPREEIVGLRLSNGWPWRPLLDTADGQSHWVLFLGGGALWQPRQRRRAHDALDYVARKIGAHDPWPA